MEFVDFGTWTRDRSGGHQSKTVTLSKFSSEWDGTLFSPVGRKFIKRMDRRRARREHAKIMTEALRVYEEDRFEEHNDYLWEDTHCDYDDYYHNGYHHDDYDDYDDYNYYDYDYDYDYHYDDFRENRSLDNQKEDLKLLYELAIQDLSSLSEFAPVYVKWIKDYVELLETS